MITINGEVKYCYSITKTCNIFDADNDALLSGGDYHSGARRFIFIDENVYRLYGEQLEAYFRNRGIITRVKLINAGDDQKNERNFISVFNDVCDFDVKRRSEPIIAIGGGVVTDLGGFVASTYRRGVPHIKVPTTLMGYVDASVGIKTGVNFGDRKNRMGTFEIPSSVILDKAFLKTLDSRNIVNGIGEIIKLAVILDRELFDVLEAHGEQIVKEKFSSDIGQSILDRSIIGMVNELSPNLYESDLKRKVDFGHTFSLAIESASDYSVMHGEAVAIDILLSCYISRQRGLLSQQDLERVVELYDKLGVTKWDDGIYTDLLWKGVEERIMHRDGRQLIPAPRGIGNCHFINDLARHELASAIQRLKNDHASWSESDQGVA